MQTPISEGQQQNDHNCSLCHNPPDKNMITCTECHKEFHKICVKATDGNTYKCQQCSSIRTNSPPRSITSRRSTSSHLSQSRDIQLKLQRLEEERVMNRQYLDKKYQLLEEAEARSEQSSTKSQSVRNWLGDIPDPNTSSYFPPERDNNNVVQQTLYLPNETAYLNMPSRLQNANNSNLNHSTIICSDSNVILPTSIVYSLPTVSTAAITSSPTMSAAPICTTAISSCAGYPRRMQQSRPTVATHPPGVIFAPTVANAQNNHTTNSWDNSGQQQHLFNSNSQPHYLHHPISSTMHIPHNVTTNASFYPPIDPVPHQRLLQNNITARQSLPKELPSFSGQPEEWPLFSSTFEWSTATCAFTDAENLIRLQKALKGDALQSVQQLLVHPSNVPGVIQVLHMLYGQPEKIINSIKIRIKSSPKVDENNLHSLTSFAINVRNLIATINASNLNDEINNSSLLLELLQKLPSSYQMQWATQRMHLINQNIKANLYEFDKWMFDVGMTASSITVDHCANKSNKEKAAITSNTTNKKAYVYSHSERICIVCNNNNNKHCKSVATCPTFLSYDRGEKWSVVRKHKLCKFCLCKHSGECRRKMKCGKEGCEYFHHPTLHRYSEPAIEQQNKTSNTNINNTHVVEKVVNNTHSVKIKDILFKIIPIKMYGKNKIIETFAFIDEGSSISLMDESLAKQLDVNGIHSPLCLRWTGGMERSEENSQKLTIEISGGNQRRMNMNVCTVKSLNLPIQSLDYQMLSQRYRHLRNLPVRSYSNAEPKLLIGLNHFDLGISSKIREGSPHEPVAVCTKLGWLVYGAVAENKDTRKHFNFSICDCSTSDENLEELVRSFYSLESVGISVKDPLIADNDKRALHLLNTFTKRLTNCHYEVPLLWKFDVIELPDSYEMALKRLICLERKLAQNSDLFNIFKDTISKYLSKGYIRKLNSHEMKRADKKVWYLPIFAVFNKNKPGKSRVVWDAAAKSNGLSLNSFLLKGPDLLASLPSIIFKFRQKSVAVCGDIEEMFHQVYIRPDDRDVQRFLWRDCLPDKDPEVYVMDVMIFGATCAPSISQYIKNINATQFANEFPIAAKSIIENHYVDDLLDSVDTPQEAIKLIADVSYIHCQAGFNIRNWISNDKLVMNSLPKANSKGVKCLNLKEEKQIEKVLGVFWEHHEDVITFKISMWLRESDIFAGIKTPTKREMLRLVMSIYDPLGLIGHVIMYVKVLMKEVWRSNIDWDDQIPPELTTKWTQWVTILPDIQNIKIPRCYLHSFNNYNNVDVQLHTFVDASKDGYAAVCYFRLRKNDVILCSIVGSKTRVAPMKITSVPRLELMAAVIGARFAKFIIENHDIKISQKYYWSDSKTVLSWINSDHRKYQQFVAFRITEILELSSIKDWRWVPSKQNVADDGTKWSKIPKISDSSRWLKGPDFLYQPEDNWPKTDAPPESTEEERVHHSFKITKLDSIVDVCRFSKWTRLVRSIAYVLRFIAICSRKPPKPNNELTQVELRKAEIILYRQAQLEKYYAEIFSLRSNQAIAKSSDIYKKSPYLEDGILRVDGRIDRADVRLEQKRPIILPRKGYITKLILMHFHEKLYHINHETAINEIRQKFAISKLRATFKSIVRSCQMCKIKKAAPKNPQMAKLPRARVASYVAPFTFTGIDFFGPMLVTVNRHKEKRYGCLFTCLTIRAVHIEVAHSLTTSSCILAIRNFIARRGIPHEFYSDNGTNFVGAERELRETLVDVDSNEFVKAFTTTTTKWNFNPPASPHMGGSWERLVRSIKTILYKIMPSRSPCDELLSSMLIEVENIVNSRPLVYVPVDEDTDEALTPNHFLVGSSSGMKPMSVCSDNDILLKKSWLTSQQYANIFWKKWLTEYLPSLTCRTKWYDRTKPLCQGDLVIIVDPSLPRNVWLRGKVLETRLAEDGQVRSAKVLTQCGILERPAAKLAILEVAPQQKSDGEEASCHTAGGMLTPLPKSP